MAEELILDGYTIKLDEYKEALMDGLRKVSVRFKVTSEEYHDIAVLLYKGSFQVSVPERNHLFEGRIIQYFTSLTNLYQEGQTGDFHLTLLEIAGEGSQK